MNLFMPMLAIILVATAILVMGIRLNHDAARSMDGSIAETVSWGIGFFLCYTSQAAIFFLH